MVTALELIFSDGTEPQSFARKDFQDSAWIWFGFALGLIAVIDSV